MAMKTVFIQNWEESERGWGVRPDGFTVHVSRAQRDEYVKWYNATFNDADEAPDEYTRISGNPIEIECSDELYERLKWATLVTHKGRTLNAVHGKEKFFSTETLRALKEDDIEWRK